MTILNEKEARDNYEKLSLKPTFYGTCHKCKAKLEYNKNDLIYDVGIIFGSKEYKAKCPICGAFLEVQRCSEDYEMRKSDEN